MIWFLAACCVILYIAMGFVLRPMGLQPLWLQFTYSCRQFEAIYRPWTELQKQRYALHFKLDYAFLLLYGPLGYFLAIGASPLAHSPNSVIQAVAPVIMPLAAAADAVENVLHQWMIRTIRTRSLPDAVVLAAGVVATTKWVLFGLFLLMLASACHDLASPARRPSALTPAVHSICNSPRKVNPARLVGRSISHAVRGLDQNQNGGHVFHLAETSRLS